MKDEQTRYVFDKVTGTFIKATRSVWRPVRALLRVLAYSIALSVGVYAVFAFFVSNDLERTLHRQNRAYAKAYAQMQARCDLVEDVVADLQLKDGAIYEEIFHSPAPSSDPVSSLDFLFGSDTIPDTKIISYTARKADNLVSDSDSIEAYFHKILVRLASKDSIVPPMGLPVKDIKYPQVGATSGSRMNPFYKVSVQHTGIDLLVPQGDPVLAAGDGIVSNVIRSTRGQGNVVEITHKGGYMTRYAHLSWIVVSKGQPIRKGKPIGSVGITGNTLVPHLHYEVLKDGVVLDPVRYIAAGADPEDYANMLYMAVNTEQSMD